MAVNQALVYSISGVILPGGRQYSAGANINVESVIFL